MIRPIVNAVFLIMCQSKHPLQTKSEIEIDMLEDTETHIDDSENLFTAATQVRVNKNKNFNSIKKI
jgi:hypothetical protein